MQFRLSCEEGVALSDTLIADVFIADYMLGLSHLALQTYLVIQLVWQNGNRKITEAGLAQRLGRPSPEVSAALDQLVDKGLVKIFGHDLVLVDLKQEEIKRTQQKMNRQVQLPEGELSRREMVIQQISDTFFQGVMPVSFYSYIDDWFNNYRFEPEVVYTIFREAAERNTLNGPGYVASIADSWARSGVRTYAQLEQYYAQYERDQQVFRQIRKKLNLRSNLTSYQQELVKKWLDEYKYDFDIIDLALAETINLASPNLKYVDAILRNWQARGLRTLDEVKDFLKEVKSQAGKVKAIGSRTLDRAGAAKADFKNFTERSAADRDYADLLWTDEIIKMAEEGQG